MSQSARTTEETTISIAIADVASAKCLYFPPAAPWRERLPAWLMVQGPDARRLVRGVATDGAADRSVVQAAVSLRNALASESKELDVPVQIWRPTRREVMRHLDTDAFWKIAVASIVLLAAVAGAVVAFAYRQTALGVAVVVLVLFVLAALVTAINEVRVALAPPCQ